MISISCRFRCPLPEKRGCFLWLHIVPYLMTKKQLRVRLALTCRVFHQFVIWVRIRVSFRVGVRFVICFNSLYLFIYRNRSLWAIRFDAQCFTGHHKNHNHRDWGRREHKYQRGGQNNTNTTWKGSSTLKWLDHDSKGNNTGKLSWMPISSMCQL